MSVERLSSSLGSTSVKAMSKSVDEKPLLPIARDNGGVPQRVQRHRPCIGICIHERSLVAQAKRRFAAALDRAMRTEIKDSSKVIANVEVLFCFKIWFRNDDGIASIKKGVEMLMPFASISNGAGDIWKATCAGLGFEAVSTGRDSLLSCQSYDGAECVMKREPFARSLSAFGGLLPFIRGVNVGRLGMHVTASWFPDCLLSCDSVLFRVVMRRLTFAWGNNGPDKLIISSEVPGA